VVEDIIDKRGVWERGIKGWEKMKKD